MRHAITPSLQTSNGSTPEHCVFEDPIMLSQLAIPMLVEAQFEPGGEWVLAMGTVESIEGEKV